MELCECHQAKYLTRLVLGLMTKYELKLHAFRVWSFLLNQKVCVSRHTPSDSAPNLGAVLFHAYAHMRTRARNAHARARAHMRVIY